MNLARGSRRIAALLKSLADPAPPAHDEPFAAVFDHLKSVMGSSNVLGFGQSTKRTGGQATDNASIVFYVKRKKDLASLRAKNAIPRIVIDRRGRPILTDVVETGKLVLHVQAQRSPICSGFSIGHLYGKPGTLAAIVAKGGAVHALSAQHVLANSDRGTVGDAIIFPARDDSGTVADRIGTLAAYTPLATGPGYPNRIDAALCILDPGTAQRLDPSIPGVSRPIQVADPSPGMPVQLTGRTSATVIARIRGLNAYADFYHKGIGLVGFRELIECDPYAQGGDSGALIVDRNSGSAVGLHIGGSDTASFFVPIRAVLKGLGISFS